MKHFLLFNIIFLFNACGKNEIPSGAFSNKTVQNSGNSTSQKEQDSSEKKNSDSQNSNPTPSEPETQLTFEMGSAPSDYLQIQEVSDLIKQWSAKASPIAKVESYGTANGFNLEYLHINASTQPNAPKVLIDAATHGDEPISTLTILGVTHKLLAGFGKNPEVTAILKSRDIYVVPVVCPDGYANDSREVEGGQDPNRTFPYPGEPNRSSVQCISALRNLFLKVGFNATIDYHASGRMILLPWGYTNDRFSDGNRAAVYKLLGQKLATQAQYDWGQIPDMVGYIAPGGSLDYFYIEGKKQGFNTFALGVEVAVSKQPARSEIPIEVNKNYPALMTFIKEAPIAFANSYKLTDEIRWPEWKGLSPYFVPNQE